jgi:hypothetical protein
LPLSEEKNDFFEIPFFVLIVMFLNHLVVYSKSEDRADIVDLMKQKQVKGIYLFNPNVEIDTFFRNCEKIGVNCVSSNDFFIITRNL